MPRPLCREDLFEHHVGTILRRMRSVYKDFTPPMEASFEDWLWLNADLVGKEFLDDVESWMGIEEAIKQERN